MSHTRVTTEFVNIPAPRISHNTFKSKLRTCLKSTDKHLIRVIPNNICPIFGTAYNIEQQTALRTLIPVLKQAVSAWQSENPEASGNRIDRSTSSSAQRNASYVLSVLETYQQSLNDTSSTSEADRCPDYCSCDGDCCVCWVGETPSGLTTPLVASSGNDSVSCCTCCGEICCCCCNSAASISDCGEAAVYCCIGIPLLIITSIISIINQSKDDNDAEDSESHRRLSALDPIKDSHTATILLGTFFIVICVPLLIRLSLNTYRNIESIVNNRAPRHSTSSLLLDGLAGGAAVGATAGAGFGIASMTTWFVFFAGSMDFYFNSFATHNSNFEKFFTFTAARFNLIMQVAIQSKPSQETDENFRYKFLAELGKEAHGMHAEYIKNGRLTDRNPSALKQFLYTYCVSGFYYLSPQNTALLKLQSSKTDSDAEGIVKNMITKAYTPA
jgi:hypothetical protein